MTTTERAKFATHDATVTCYQATNHESRPATVETVHERRSDGACRCGQFTPRD